jgi:L-fuculose-phosphate aldolase
MKMIHALKKELVEIGRRVYMRGYVAANDGNISIRLDGDRILITPTGVSKGYMTPEMMVVCDMEGKSLTPGLKASSEIIMHTKTYQMRSDVQAIVHAHPPYATATGIAGIPLVQAILPEVIITLGSIPLIEYGTPGTEEIFSPLIPWIADHDAFLLQNHGALTYGPNLETAYFRMETLEHFAHIAFISKLLGNIHTLEENQITKLLKQREKSGLPCEFDVSACDGNRTGACSILKKGERILEKRKTCDKPDDPEMEVLIKNITETIIRMLTERQAP